MSIICIVASLGVTAFWFLHIPEPGKAVALLGGVAVFLALRGEIKEIHGSEKIIWTLIVFALLYTEIRAIDRDHELSAQKEANARAEQLSEFGKIAGGINTTLEENQTQFEATMARSDAIMAGVSDSMKTQTGGDSFAYITFTPEPNQQFLVAITSHGKYPLREVHITMMDQERSMQGILEYNKHPEGDWIKAIHSGDTYYRVPYLRPQSAEATSGDVEMLGAYPFSSRDTNDLSIAFSSLNGYWNERLHLRRVDGKWHQALSVMGPTAKQALHPFIYFDHDYPEGKALAEKDWPRAKPQSRHR